MLFLSIRVAENQQQILVRNPFVGENHFRLLALRYCK